MESKHGICYKSFLFLNKPLMARDVYILNSWCISKRKLLVIATLYFSAFLQDMDHRWLFVLEYWLTRLSSWPQGMGHHWLFVLEYWLATPTLCIKCFLNLQVCKVKRLFRPFHSPLTVVLYCLSKNLKHHASSKLAGWNILKSVLLNVTYTFTFWTMRQRIHRLAHDLLSSLNKTTHHMHIHTHCMGSKHTEIEI